MRGAHRATWQSQQERALLCPGIATLLTVARNDVLPPGIATLLTVARNDVLPPGIATLLTVARNDVLPPGIMTFTKVASQGGSQISYCLASLPNVYYATIILSDRGY